MGGRGSGSMSYGNSGNPQGKPVVIVWGDAGGEPTNPLPLAGKTAFYGGNRTDTAATASKFEDESYGLGHEELLFIDNDGFARAYFTGNSGSVSFTLPKNVKVSDLTATHNHPIGDGRSIGGTFSAADMGVLARYGLKEMRATSVEGSYSLKPTSRADSQGFLKALSRYDSTVSAKTKASVRAGDTRPTIDILLEHAHNWVSDTAPKYGYDYTFKKRAAKVKNQHGQTSMQF